MVMSRLVTMVVLVERVQITTMAVEILLSKNRGAARKQRAVSYVR